MVGNGFVFLDHTADVLVEAYGSDLREAFENAAKAMFEVMTDISTVKPVVRKYIVVEGEDLQALLYSWLEELLFIFDVELIVFSKFKVKEIRRVDGKGYLLMADAWGERFNPDVHPRKTEVKAVTYSLMEIREYADRCVVRFVLDI